MTTALVAPIGAVDRPAQAGAPATSQAPMATRGPGARRAPAPWPGCPDVAQATEDAFLALLARPDVHDALATLHGRVAPDPAGFGYARLWGKALGLSADRCIPQDETLLCIWQTDAAVEAWLCPQDPPESPSAHAALLHAAQGRLLREAFDAFHRRIADLWAQASDQVPVHRALWTTVGLGTLHLSERVAAEGTNGRSCSRMIPLPRHARAAYLSS